MTMPFGSTQSVNGVFQSPAQIGGSGRAYFNVPDAIAGEIASVETGTTVAGTVSGTVVGPAGFAAVNLVGRWVVSVASAPGNGKAGIYARVIAQAGVTLTIDSDLDFGVGTDLHVVAPAVVNMNKDQVGNVTIAKNCILNMGGCKIVGQINITSGAFCWIRGGEITDGIQKTDSFNGPLRMENLVVSARGGTIFAFLMNFAGDVGAVEAYNCEFRGVVEGHRGKVRWIIKDCVNRGIQDSVGNIPYRLIRNTALANVSIAIDSEFSGAILYAQSGDLITSGAPNYLELAANIKPPMNGVDGSTILPGMFSLMMVVGTGAASATVSAGQIEICYGSINGGVEIGDQTTSLIGFSLLRSRGCTGAGAILTLSDGFSVDLDFTGFAAFGSLICVDGPGGGSTSNLTLNGTSEIGVTLGAEGMFSGVLLLETYSGAGTITCNPALLRVQGGLFVSGIYFAHDQTTNTPTVTSTMLIQIENSLEFQWFGFDDDVVTITKGSYTFSGQFNGVALGNYVCSLTSVVSGGTWTVSGNIFAGMIGSAQKALDIASSFGTGGTLTVSGQFYATGGVHLSCRHCHARAAGANVTRSGNTFVRNMAFYNGFAFVFAEIGGGSPSVAVGSGAVSCYSVIFEQAGALAVNVVNVVGTATGPTQVVFEFCRWDGAGFATQTGGGALTWAAGTIPFYMDHCSMIGVFTIVGTPFSLFEVFESTFYGAIGFSGSRPATRYAWFKCSFQTTFFDATGKPDILDDYFILANNSSSKARGQLVKTGTTPSVVNTGATDVVDGVVFEAVGANTNPVVLVKTGVISVLATGSVAIGDNLILDVAGTPTKVVPFVAGTLLVGQNIGRALTADSGGLAYSNVNIR